eukprot:CAMPEP_0170452670 /NCGR_PEP_ID=MMETSP0123-20130129/1490_1 /TAXON_ID=182087 /ORGANISM="Favella ehrenbergii, Strain Fehren 1" /LENGTH=37 /DNA_ID= /DNA_START= /DNA_END= /DNA_ORIENTATION=
MADPADDEEEEVYSEENFMESPDIRSKSKMNADDEIA